MEQHANTAAIMIDDEPATVANNVIMFPRSAEMIEFPNTMLEAQAILDETRQYMAEEVADEATEAAIQIFKNYGCFARHDSMPTKDIVALNETMKAILFRYYNLHHPLQGVFDEAIQLTIRSEEDVTEEGTEEGTD